jgi:hypothetical protein|eukprot:7378166-Prymnesium_polylepis.1
MAAEFEMGFFSAEDRAAGILTPDMLSVTANDATADAAFNEALHPTLRSGRFELWPLLTAALAALRAAHLNCATNDFERWMRLCEEGALCFVRRVGLSAGLGRPLFEWRHHTPRTCERFGEAFASFAHTDLRIANLEMLNIWVPVSDTVSEPLLLFAAGVAVDRHLCAWSTPADKACQLPPCFADAGTWFHWPGTRLGHAIVFPGDGGDAAGPGIFHGSASETSGQRLSFDARECFDAAPAAESQAFADAEARLAKEKAEWEARVEAMLEAEPEMAKRA